METSTRCNTRLYVTKRVFPCLLFVAALVITGCATLPAPPPTPHVHALVPSETGTLAQVWPKVKAKGHAAEVLEAVKAL